jgi:hypothetical protein
VATVTDPIMDVEEIARALKSECAGFIEETGLLAIVERYGRPRVTGSYALDLMVWRDLDIELVAEGLSVNDFFALGRDLASRLQPARMSFRDERLMETRGLPRGMYWGIHLPGEGNWKIDVWAMDRAEAGRRSPYAAWVAAGLTPATRRAILEIKSAIWNLPGYRSDYSSKDVYDAVLSHGVRDVERFRDYLFRKKQTA